MQRSHEDWLADFQAILYSGYFSTGNAGDKFRQMEQANVKLKVLYKALVDDVLKPVGNGKPIAGKVS